MQLDELPEATSGSGRDNTMRDHYRIGAHFDLNTGLPVADRKVSAGTAIAISLGALGTLGLLYAEGRGGKGRK